MVPDEFEQELTQLREDDFPINRLAATIDFGQGETAAKLMVLQLVHGNRRHTDRWQRGRINGYYCFSSHKNVSRMFQEIGSIFGGVQWYNSSAIHKDDVTYTFDNKSETINEGVLFDPSVKALYLNKPSGLRKSTSAELEDIFGVEQYPVRTNGVKETLTPSASVGLVVEPRSGVWDDDKTLSRQLNIDNSLLGQTDFFYTDYNDDCSESTDEPVESTVAYLYVNEVQKLSPSITQGANKQIVDEAERLSGKMNDIEDDELNKILSLPYSNLRETLERFSLAYAKANWEDEVTQRHVCRASNLIVETWKDMGVENIMSGFEFGVQTEQKVPNEN